MRLKEHVTLNFNNNMSMAAVFLDIGKASDTSWQLHTEIIEAKAFKTFIRIYSLFKSERLRANIKLTLHKTVTRSIMTYACPALELAAGTYLLKLQRLQNKVLRTV
jgi:hypothetical protein